MAWGDFFGTSWDDPKTMMMMQAAAGLLAGNPVGQNRATLGQSLSRGLLGGMQGYQQGLQAKRQGEQLELQKREADLREQQLQAELDAKRQEQMRAQQQGVLRGALPGLLGGQGMTGPQAMALGATQGSVGPTQANAARMAPSPGGLSQQFLQAALASGMKPEEIKTLSGAQQWNQRDPMNVAAGSTVFDPNTRQPIFTAPQQQKLPDGWQMGPNGPQPIPGYEQFRRNIASAGATRVNVPVSVNTEKQLFGQIADQVGKNVADQMSAAQGAAGALRTVAQIREALDSGKVMAGPATSARVVMTQVGQMLGIGGKDATETLANTRSAIQGLAQLELDAAQQMKGQGQITEAERSIIRRAAAGDIDKMTTQELRVLTDTLDKTARWKIAANQRNVERLRQQPGAAPVTPFMDVQMPPAYQPPAGAPTSGPDGWSIRPKGQ